MKTQDIETTTNDNRTNPPTSSPQTRSVSWTVRTDRFSERCTRTALFRYTATEGWILQHLCEVHLRVRGPTTSDLGDTVTLTDLPGWILRKADIPQPASGGEARA